MENFNTRGGLCQTLLSLSKNTSQLRMFFFFLKKREGGQFQVEDTQPS